MFAMLENGAITIAPKEIDGVINPPDSVYYEHGYSRVIFTTMPMDGVYESTWKQIEKTIMQEWKVIDGEQVSNTEALEIILGGAE